MAVTSAYIMIGQDKRELLMLGGETPETQATNRFGFSRDMDQP